MPNPRKVVLVDGDGLMLRAYYAVPGNLVSASGLHTNSLFGLASMFRRMLAGRRVDLGAVVLQADGPTAREARHPGHRTARPELPPELAEQLPWIEKVAEVNGYRVLRVPGVEAADVIATLAAAGRAAALEVVVVAADKRLGQLVDGELRMYDPLRNLSYDPDLVQKKWGVRPEQIVDFLALKGDDGAIPGVPGIGEKGAAALLEKYGSLDGVLAHLGELKGRQRAGLDEHRGAALLGRELAALDRDAALPVTLEKLEVKSPDAGAFNALYKELQFFALLAGEAAPQAPSVTGGEERPRVRVLDTMDAVTAAFESFANTNVAVVPLYDLPSAVTGRLAGFALAAEAAPPLYLPIAGAGPTMGDAGLVLARRWFEDPRAPKVAHNVKELYQLLRRREVRLAGVRGDTMLASFLVEPNKIIPHHLDQVAREYLQRTLVPLKQYTGAGQKERAVTELAVAAAAEYGGAVAAAVAAVWPILDERVRAMGYLEQLEDRDLPLAFVLGRMELDGILVDAAELRRVGEEFAVQLAEHERHIHRLAGREFNIGSTRQLAEVLFEELALPVGKKNKTGYSTDSEVLERLAGEHEIARVLLEHRKLAKLINTYTDVLQHAIHPATGRIHACFQQTVGVTGRLISTDPDLQRTPVKTPEGRRIRKAFVPAPGYRLLSADWSQIELRLLAHLSGDVDLVRSFRAGLDVHRRTASQLFHCGLGEVTPAQRGVGKTVNFATIYGQGATALAQILGIPRKEAQHYIDGYFAAYAGVRVWLDRTIAEAHQRGYVTTLLGRRRFISELSSNNVMDRQAGERIAANTPIQGSAADLCKLAMLRIAEGLESRGLRTRMLMQIHDELVFESPTDEVAAASALVREVMEGVYPLEVPLVVDLGVGGSWSEAH